MSFVNQLLSEENRNSRFIYLINGVASSFCVVALVIATIGLGIRGRSGDEKFIDGFIYMTGVVLAGGVGIAGGRWLTTKKGPALPVELSESETRTTTTKTKVGKPKVNA